MLTFQGSDGCDGCVGENDLASFECYYKGAFYICKPKTSALLTRVADMQKAVDAFLNVVPLYKTPDYPLGQNPIGSSKSGYDGRVGPNTSKLAAWASTVAAEMHREAGEGDPPAPIIIDIRLVNEKDSVHHACIYAAEITAYLNDTTARINELVAAIKAKQAPEATSVFVAPPPLPVPAEIRATVPTHKFSTGRLILGGVTAVAAAGTLGALLMRGKSSEEPAVTMPMMGAPSSKRAKKYHVGMSTKTGRFEVFRASRKPTETSHGKRFRYSIGPFRTRAGAVCMAKYGKDNPHLQTVNEAERAAKTWCK